MKRYRRLKNAVCLECGKWLCVMNGTYTGEIQCDHCGAVNVFRDAARPCETRVSIKHLSTE